MHLYGQLPILPICMLAPVEALVPMNKVIVVKNGRGSGLVYKRVQTRDGYEPAEELKFIMNSGLFGVCELELVN